MNLKTFVCSVLLFCIPQLGYANYECYQIKQPDERHYCLSLSRGNIYSCYAIKNADKRTLCLAQLRQQKSQCYNIKDRDQRYFCLSQFH